MFSDNEVLDENEKIKKTTYTAAQKKAIEKYKNNNRDKIRANDKKVY